MLLFILLKNRHWVEKYKVHRTAQNIVAAHCETQMPWELEESSSSFLIVAEVQLVPLLPAVQLNGREA